MGLNTGGGLPFEVTTPTISHTHGGQVTSGMGENSVTVGNVTFSTEGQARPTDKTPIAVLSELQVVLDMLGAIACTKVTPSKENPGAAGAGSYGMVVRNGVEERQHATPASLNAVS